MILKHLIDIVATMHEIRTLLATIVCFLLEMLLIVMTTIANGCNDDHKVLLKV